MPIYILKCMLGVGGGGGGGIVICLVLMHSKHLVQNKKWSCIDIHVYVVYGTAKYHTSYGYGVPQTKTFVYYGS